MVASAEVRTISETREVGERRVEIPVRHLHDVLNVILHDGDAGEVGYRASRWRSMPSRREIAEWWAAAHMRLAPDPKKPQDTPPGVPRSSELRKEWDEWYEETRRAEFYPCIDLAEPSCWACGQFTQTEYDGHANAYNLVSYLTKCHLLAVSYGGSDHPANLVLLCDRCHRLQPDDDYVRAVQWVNGFARRWTASWGCVLQGGREGRRLPGDELAREWVGKGFEKYLADVYARHDELRKKVDASLAKAGPRSWGKGERDLG